MKFVKQSTITLLRLETKSQQLLPVTLMGKIMCYMSKQQCSSVILNPTDHYEIVEIIDSLNSHKTPGFIDIPVALIKSSKQIIASYLSRSLNECINQGFYPDELKIA